jgi:hypothetical protein
MLRTVRNKSFVTMIEPSLASPREWGNDCVVLRIISEGQRSGPNQHMGLSEEEVQPAREASRN